jgi:hypothetical protein
MQMTNRGGFHVELPTPPSVEGLLICDCGHKTPVDMRLLQGSPVILPGQPGWVPKPE